MFSSFPFLSLSWDVFIEMCLRGLYIHQIPMHKERSVAVSIRFPDPIKSVLYYHSISLVPGAFAILIRFKYSNIAFGIAIEKKS